jgi:hypothetical protein
MPEWQYLYARLLPLASDGRKFDACLPNWQKAAAKNLKQLSCDASSDRGDTSFTAFLKRE